MHPQAITIRTKKLGVLIYDARLARRRSVEECAKAVGVSQDVFQSFETGSSSPSLPQLEILAYFLELPLEHFWSSESLSEKPPKSLETERLINLRQRLIGVMLRQARNIANISTRDLAQKSNVPEEFIHAYEFGEKPIPLPILESLLGSLGIRVEDFFDKNGPVGIWSKDQKAVSKFHELPTNLQEFVSKPVNRPYVELALRLSELSVERLRAIAEGLLEITY